MARKSKATKAVEKIIKVVKQPGYFLVLIKKDDKNIFYNTRLSKDKYLELWFKGLKENIEKHLDWSVEDFVSKYNNIWSNFTVLSDYVDSYGHKWRQTPLSDNYKKEYVEKMINDLSSIKTT